MEGKGEVERKKEREKWREGRKESEVEEKGGNGKRWKGEVEKRK